MCSISDISMITSISIHTETRITLDTLHRTYCIIASYIVYRSPDCMHMYGCELWNLNNKKIEAFRIVWRKIKRRIWKLPARAHNIIVHNLCYNFGVCFDMRMIKFVYNALNHYTHEICHNLLYTKLDCTRSTSSVNNYQYLSYKYKLSVKELYNDLEHIIFLVSAVSS